MDNMVIQGRSVRVGRAESVLCCGTSAVLTNEVMNNMVREVSLTDTGSTAFTALSLTGGRSELTANNVTNTANTATLRLLDALGRQVWQQEQSLLPGAAPVRVQPTCAAGSYVLTATVGGQVLRQRVVKD